MPEAKQPAGYEPSSRRPIADFFRRAAKAPVGWCVRHGIHPDVVSYGSLFASAGAALCFWRSGQTPWLLIPAVLFCYLRLWLNMLDGMVALASGKASQRGELLNELPDRISDVMIFVGVAHSGLCHPLSGYWAALFALFTAYVGMFGQALGVGRQFGGVMAKPWRMVVLHVGAWLTFAMVQSNDGNRTFGGLTVLDWANLVVVAGALQTIVVRLAAILRRLERTA
jgi:phosphatidylglycerophosphate synthase